MTLEVRLATLRGGEASADRDFIRALGRASVMSSIGPLRDASEAAAVLAFERLFEIVETQSHVALIAHENGRRVGFLLMLDGLPDEVTLTDQGFIAYMAVEPEAQHAGVGTALLTAAEDEARHRGLPHIALMVTEENAAARRLYEHAGYRTERRLLCKVL